MSYKNYYTPTTYVQVLFNIPLCLGVPEKYTNCNPYRTVICENILKHFYKNFALFEIISNYTRSYRFYKQQLILNFLFISFL